MVNVLTILFFIFLQSCSRGRGMIARTRYINALTDWLTYISSTCANFGPDWHILNINKL